MGSNMGGIEGFSVRDWNPAGLEISWEKEGCVGEVARAAFDTACFNGDNACFK